MPRLILTALSAVLFAAGPSRAEFIVGLTSTNGLVTFDSATPGSATTVVGITGTTGNIVAIDFRPQDGLLYGLTSAGSLYTIDVATGAATFRSTLSVAASIAASAVGGFDFNPVANALRIITTAGDNFRLPAAQYGTGTTTTDTAISGTGIGSIVGSAYTNNFAGAASTALFGIDSNGNLVSTAAANGGVYSVVGSLGGGSLSTPGADTGFDISGLTGTAYANLSMGSSGNSALYTIDLSSGLATRVGFVRPGTGRPYALLDIAATAPGGLVLILTGAATAGLVRRGRRVIG